MDPVAVPVVPPELTQASSPVLSWIRFILALAGSFYICMTGSLVLHEVLGHGLASVLCGSRGMTFVVDPGFAGWAVGTDPPSPSHIWIITYAGIAVNVLVGVAALLALRCRRLRLTPASLALFWVATTELGHAIGYTLMGLLFRQGDAARLPELLGPAGRDASIALLTGLFLLLARWALSTAAGFVRDHFRSAGLRAFRTHFLLGFTLPMAAVVVGSPGLPGRPFWTIVAFDACVLAVALVVTVWSVRRLPPATEPEGVPVGGWGSVAWTVGAGGTFAAAQFWLSRGVTLTFA